MLNKRHKYRIYIYSLIISVILSVLISVIINSSINPNSFEAVYEFSLNENYQGTMIYDDIDRDGISETVLLRNNKENDGNAIFIRNYRDDIIDQLNYFESVNYTMGSMNVLFADYNGDNLDDVFTLTQAGDSLFLYMHDLYQKKVIIDRYFLFKTRPPYLKSDNLFQVNGMKLIDHSGKGKKVLLFSVSSRRSINPRGVYLFDIEEQKIISEFEAAAFFMDVFTFDLTGDGNDEIILTSNAVGNVHYQTEYSDQKCWLFVLDHNLNPLFEPLSFGIYRTEIDCVPLESQSERFLLISKGFGGNENFKDAIFFINKNGEILPERKMDFSQGLSFIKPLIVEKTNNDLTIFTCSGKNGIISLDEKFNIVNQTSTSFKRITPYTIKDLDRDGKNEIICLSLNDIVVFNNRLDFLTSIHIPIIPETNISFRENGVDKPIDIGINAGNIFSLYSFQNNPVYTLLPFITAGIFLLIFFLLLLIYLILANLFLFFSYHRFSLVNSNEGAMMIDHSGLIKNYNSKAEKIFNLNRSSSKNQYFDIKLAGFPGVIRLFEKCLKLDHTVTDCITISTQSTTLECEVCVTPLIPKMKLFRNYLLEIKDYDSSDVSNKLIIWSKAAQRMVHDIKYPLSVAAIKLDTLKTRISALQVFENDDITKNFEVIKSEIKRVNSIAKSFLKFSDLEKPNFQHVSVKKIINNCIKRYEQFISDKLKLQSAIEEDVETIWADEQQIELAIHNLVENSIDAVNGNGLIMVSAYLAQYLDEPYSDKVEIEVADTGPGIDEIIRESIFQPHTTTKSDGSGIGLAISKKIIEDHGSTIDFYSKPGFGTVVRFAIRI